MALGPRWPSLLRPRKPPKPAIGRTAYPGDGGAAGGVSRGGRRGVGARAAVAHVGPQPAGFRGAPSGREHRHRGVIGVNRAAAQDVPAHGPDQGPQQGGRFPHPAGQGRARQIDTRAGVDFRLAIERQMIRILRDQDVCQQPRSRQAPRDRPTGSRGLGRSGHSGRRPAWAGRDQ